MRVENQIGFKSCMMMGKQYNIIQSTVEIQINILNITDINNSVKYASLVNTAIRTYF